MSNNQPQPFSIFGQALKKLRQKTSETQIEVSGAVEIEPASLRSFEQGETRPTEDILLLLIKHFDLSDKEAAELWRLAGYGQLPADENRFFMNDGMSEARIMQAVPITMEDGRIVYTDMVQVMVNNFGVVINFMQGMGASGPVAVARVGMSKEHAKSVLDVLNTTLEQATEIETKSKLRHQLPSGTIKKKKGQ